MQMSTNANPKNRVQSLAKGLHVLETFTATETEFTLSEIASRAGLDPGTAFRMIHTLVSLGYLQKVENTRMFRLSLKVLDLGFNAIARTDLRTIARPILRSLVADVIEAASLAVLDGAEMVYLERVHAGLARLGVDVRIGTRLPAYYTAMGLAVLAFLPRKTVLRVLNMRERVKLTPATPVTIAEITQCLERIRRQGYAVADPEVIVGLRVLAAPVLDADGQSVAAISVAAPSMNINLKKFVEKTATPVMQAAAELEKVLQLSGTAPAGAVSAV
jgi:IclR family pca regulon transcriptional regulator